MKQSFYNGTWGFYRLMTDNDGRKVKRSSVFYHIY